MVNETPDVFSELSGSFADAHLADGGPQGAPGVPGVGVDPRGLYVTGFGTGTATVLGAGDDVAEAGVERIDSGGSEVTGEPKVDVAESGAAVAAWRELRSGAGLVGIQERRADRVVEPTVLGAPHGGAVGRLVMGGSGLGDAIVAWEQGSDANSQIVGSVVDAPPDPFFILLPEGWQRKGKIPIAWDRALNAIGGVHYSVSVDDEPVIESRRALHARLTRDDIDDGRHRIQVFAVDDAGQETGSRSGRLLVDRTAPRIALRRHGRRLNVIVGDGARNVSSGLRRRSVKVSFGDRHGGRAAASSGKRGHGGKGKRAPLSRHRTSSIALGATRFGCGRATGRATPY